MRADEMIINPYNNGYIEMSGHVRGDSFAASTIYNNSDSTVYIPNLAGDTNPSAMQIPLTQAFSSTDGAADAILCGSSYKNGIYISKTGHYEISGKLSGTTDDNNWLTVRHGIVVHLVYFQNSTLPTTWTNVYRISSDIIYPTTETSFSLYLPPKLRSISSGSYIYLLARYSGNSVSSVRVDKNIYSTYVTVRRVD